MSSIVSFSDTLTPMTCEAGTRVTSSYTARCVADEGLEVGVRVVTEGDLPEAWLSVDIGNSKRLRPGEDLAVDVHLDAPKSAPPGSFAFSLLVFDLKEPGERFDESGAIPVTVTPPPEAPVVQPPKPRRSWLVTLIGGAVTFVLAFVVGAVLGTVLDEILGRDNVKAGGQAAVLWIGSSLFCAIMVGIAIRRHFTKLHCFLSFWAPLLLAAVFFIKLPVADYFTGIMTAVLAFLFWQKLRETAN
ncbi:hypothetical protein DEA8626_03344 [Defluviimonas aquaemixtae]|uniref:Uncharacterized protein n=1 Tax=Albidovulum aquaemixtae TaxID=1542388 RepID=A0A2R8BLI1_9RHOB|nr:hypothetical protein [Defluviimonas aquaemixtae]SPH24294.1 hypothetical protein DEA8626_03344 [Defluviimonas aquaemixtae]